VPSRAARAVERVAGVDVEVGGVVEWEVEGVCVEGRVAVDMADGRGRWSWVVW
jgi:hypothetical protein